MTKVSPLSAGDVKGDGTGTGGYGPRSSRAARPELAKSSGGLGRCRRCHFSRAERVVLWVLVVLLFGVGTYMFVEACMRLDMLQRSTSCKCQMKDFQAAQTYVVPGDPEPTCADVLGLVVAAACMPSSQYKGGILFVQNWMPAYTESYSSPTGTVPVDKRFRCCPLTLTDMCAFEEQGLFCDNFALIRQNCPAAPWPCYFLNLKAIVAEDRDLRPEELFLGDPQEKINTFASVGAFLFFLGFIVLLCLYKRQVAACLFKCCQRLLTKVLGERRASSRTEKQKRSFAFELALLLPPEFRTTKMKELVSNHSATSIQRAFRGYRARKAFKELIVRLSKDGDGRLVIYKQRCKEEDARDPTRVFAKWAQHWEKGVCSDMLAPDLSHGPRPLRGLLYDTGDSNQFKRLVANRVVSGPGEKVERVEVAFMDFAEDLDHIFRVTTKETGSRLMVSTKPSHHMATAYGLKKGQLVIKANGLTWPETDGRHLLGEIKTAARPVFLLLEGLPDPIDTHLDGIQVRRAQQLFTPSASPCLSPAWSQASTVMSSASVFRKARQRSKSQTRGGSGSDGEAGDVLLPGEVPKREGGPRRAPDTSERGLRCSRSGSPVTRPPVLDVSETGSSLHPLASPESKSPKRVRTARARGSGSPT